MKKKWFEKDLQSIIKYVGDTKKTIEDLKYTQEEKIENYPENFQNSDNLTQVKKD